MGVVEDQQAELLPVNIRGRFNLALPFAWRRSIIILWLWMLVYRYLCLSSSIGPLRHVACHALGL